MGRFMEDVNTKGDDEFFLFFPNVGAVSKNSALRNFTYIWPSKRAGIISTTFEKNVESDVFAAVAVAVAKAP